MKRITGILILVALLALVVVQLVGNKEISENRIYQYDKETPISVHAESVAYANDKAEYAFTGTFEAFKEVKMNADVQGKVVQIYIDEGASVNKGQALIKLDDQLLKHELQSVEVKIEGLETDVERYTILAKEDAIQGVKLEKAQLGLRTAIIQRNTLLEKISKTTVKAPFDGVVTMKMTEVGAFATPGVPLLMITDISKLKFTVNVSENELSLFELNKTYEVQADLDSKLILKAEATMIGSKGNRGNSFPVQFTTENTPDLALKAKMFGEVSVTLAENEKNILVPNSAILGSTVQPQVYVVKNGKARLQNVSIDRRINNKVMISNGISQGDVIITSGFINLFEGANVTYTKK